MGRKRSQIKRIHFEGEEWTYQVGTSTVSIRDPQGKRVLVPRSKITRGHPHNVQTRFDPDAWEASRSTYTYPTPALVKNYIWRKLRPGNLIGTGGDYDSVKESVLRFFCGEEKQEPELIAGTQR
jgi:hypothetical protein